MKEGSRLNKCWGTVVVGGGWGGGGGEGGVTMTVHTCKSLNVTYFCV